jgi:DNA-binding NtrC family response regulator
MRLSDEGEALRRGDGLEEGGERAYAGDAAGEAWRARLDEAGSAEAALGTLAAAQVGHESLQRVQASVKRAMVERALALAADNRTNAARLLGVSRQAVQQMIRDLELRQAAPRRARP